MSIEYQFKQMHIQSYVPELFKGFDCATIVYTEDLVLFWKPPCPFGQWTDSPFEIDGRRYMCAEQFMMAEKARLFGDHEIATAIIGSSDPREQKKLGKKVKGFEETIWHKHRLEIVVRGNIAKFSQNEHLKQVLLGTGQRRLVEASPLDRIWGIGLAADHPDAYMIERWQGLNLLGDALEIVRKIIGP